MDRNVQWPELVAHSACRSMACPPLRLRTLTSVLRLAVEIVHEGREGRRVGTLFGVGNADEMLLHSRPLILDPLAGHDPSSRHVDDAGFRETVKELAQLDGAFIVDDDGTCISAARFIEVDLDASAGLPRGLGARHAAALSISRQAEAIGIAVSESSQIRVFGGGSLRAEIAAEAFAGRGRTFFAIEDAQVHEVPEAGLTVCLADGAR